MNFKRYLTLFEQNVPGAYDGPVNGSGLMANIVNTTGNLDVEAAGRQLDRINGWNMQIPQLTKKGYIEIFRRDRPNIEGLRSPVYIQLSDGTKLWMSTHELKRVRGAEPAQGRYMVVTMQRHEADKTGQHSKIEDVICY